MSYLSYKFLFSDILYRNKCNNENNASACIESCTEGRKLDGGYCKCNLGTYDDGSNN